MLPALILSPLARNALLGFAAAVAAGAAYMWAHGRGYDSCTLERQAALADQLQRQQAIIAAKQAHGDKLAAQLAQTQQALAATKTEYLTYAHAITGNCPADLGVLVGAASSGKPLPAAPGEPAGPPPAAQASAAAIGANVAENYTRFAACYSQLNALIDWHSQKDLTK